MTDQVCRSHVYNRGIQPAVLLGEHRDTRRPQSNSHISRTTSTQAFAVSYTREGTRKHLPSYTGHATNAYKQWKDAPAHEDAWAIVLGVGSSRGMVLYVLEGSVEGREGSRQG